jgi:hypothetical protein
MHIGTYHYQGPAKVWPLTIIYKFDVDLILGANFMSHMKNTQDFENKTNDFKDNLETQWQSKQKFSEQNLYTRQSPH